MPGRFIAVPNIPPDTSELKDWQAGLFSAVKENVELLSGTRGEADLLSRAIIRGDITVVQLGGQLMGRVSASGAGYTISSVDVASLESHLALREDVQVLANDLYATRLAFDLLIRNLKGG